MATDSAYERVYRAVSEKEHQQILTTGTFEHVVPQGCEGKHFADTPEGARRFGEALFGIGRFQIVEVEVPAEAPSLYRWTNLDGYGPARFLHMDDLVKVRPRPYGGTKTWRAGLHE
ncbi:MAG: hypothetical protein ACYC3I_04500 [Gemmataceae bacterium]